MYWIIMICFFFRGLCLFTLGRVGSVLCNLHQKEKKQFFFIWIKLCTKIHKFYFIFCVYLFLILFNSFMYWKFNFCIIPHVCLLVNLSVIISLEKAEKCLCPRHFPSYMTFFECTYILFLHLVILLERK